MITNEQSVLDALNLNYKIHPSSKGIHELIT